MSRPLRVLIVEDSSDDALLVLRELRRGGFEPVYERVETPEDLRAALSNGRPWDLVISDYSLPSFSAPDALDLLRSSDPDTPFVIVSGSVGEEAAVEAMRAGAQDYVMKDRLSRLGSAVARELREAEARRRYREAEEALREQTETLEKVNSIGKMLSSELDLRKLVQAVTDEATALTGARFGAFFYNVHDPDSDAGSYTLYTISGVPREAFSKFPMPRATEIFGPTFRAEGPVRSDDVRRDPRYGKNAPYRGMPEGHLPVASYLAVPVVSRSGEVLGGLFFGHPEPGIFGEREERLALGLAAQAAIAIDNARLFESVRRSEERFGALVRGASDVVSVLDADGTIRYGSPAVERILGHRPEEMVGTNAFDYVHPEDVPAVTEAFAEAMAGEEKARVEYRFRHAGGSWRYLESAATNLLSDPSVRGVVVNSRDVTERREAEEALAQSEERYRAVVEQMAECMFLFDAETKRMLETNTAFRRLFGYTTDELREMKIYDIVEDDPANVDANVLRNLERGHYEVGERRYRRKDGSVVDVEVSGNVISYGGRGEVVLGIARDITERKRAEERMREVREEERRRIARDLHDEVLSDLVYALQDIQIRRSLSGEEDLEGTAEALRRSVEGLRAAIFEMRLQESLEHSFSASLRSLVELSRRMSRGRYEVELDLGEDFPDALPEMQGRELLRVLQEAMNNARRHSGAQRIRLALGREADHLWAEVSDDGRGFDTTVPQGGVGSSSMRQRAARLGGKLDVQSAPGRGTKVRVSVPLSRMLETLEEGEAFPGDD